MMLADLLTEAGVPAGVVGIPDPLGAARDPYRVAAEEIGRGLDRGGVGGRIDRARPVGVGGPVLQKRQRPEREPLGLGNGNDQCAEREFGQRQHLVFRLPGAERDNKRKTKSHPRLFGGIWCGASALVRL